MSKEEIFGAYVLPAIVSLLAAVAAFMGNQLKRLYEKHINDKTKKSVVRTCVKAVEQLYHDLGGPEKLEKAKDGIQEMLKEKGIAISELEMDLLIESVVSEFNYGFAKDTKVLSNDRDDNDGEKDTSSVTADAVPPSPQGEGYSEEGGSR